MRDTGGYRKFIDSILAGFPDANAGHHDLAEDISAWRELHRSITQTLGRDASLEQFLQELALRSKEPPIGPGTVALMTIHAAKGKEFDHVYLVGAAEDILPSFQSLKTGAASSQMEEERRNCFVAITRARECLTISFADQYGNWQRRPSRFIDEMGLSVPTSCE
jgi:DNA helicase-2/ATP-dependent DNA helicase PcrA